MKKCPNCGNTTDSKFCPECGADLSSVDELLVCPNCGIEVKSKFCPECGAPVVPLTDTDTLLSNNAISESDNASAETDDKVVALETAAASISTGGSKPAGKKKLNKKLIAIIVIAAVVLFALIGLLGGKNTTTTEQPTVTEEEPAEETPAEEAEPEPEPEPIDYSTIFGEFTKEEDYEGLNYDHLARNPDDYEGKMYKGSGKVLQVLESENEVDMRVAVNDSYDTIIYLVYHPSIVDSRILEDDEVTFFGESKGLYSYESTGSGTITIPMMYVHKITRN